MQVFSETAKQKRSLPPFSSRPPLLAPSDLCSLQFTAEGQTPVTAEQEEGTVMEFNAGKKNW